ncbi:MAG TPA: site-2 protease family protein [Gaiellaceae bacterium]|nr:site-2 protease family protein [Gaiellaceae bacterium]
MEPTGELRDYEPLHPKGFDWRGLAGRIWAPIGLVLGLVLKFGFAFAKFASIFVAVGGYALIWGWQFGIGFVLLILVHEMGHYLEARRQGLNPALPIFIPFLGAFVAIRGERLNPWQHAWIALAGPLVGSAGAAAVWGAGEASHSQLLQALGYTGFFLNLFNLVPIGFLDGGQIWRSLHYLRLGGAPRRAALVGAVYGSLAVLLVAGMFAAHVAQSRL